MYVLLSNSFYCLSWDSMQLIQILHASIVLSKKIRIPEMKKLTMSIDMIQV